ncbi:MAG: FKBP-type peptidyl-prolyl cis-trans isomerase [Chitinophagaceae bacterium]
MKALFFIILVSATMISSAQVTTKPKTATTTKPAVATKTVLKNLIDSASYAIGTSAATFYKQQGITNINTAVLTAAIKDVLSGKKTLLDDATCNTVMNKIMTKVQEDKSRPAIDSGMAYLAKNKLRQGVKTTPSGLQYEVITEGTGIKPVATDSVTCNYRGTLINGFEFDASYKYGQPITFVLNGVIRGWTEGLQLMSEGSKYKFYIPYNLAYGAFDNGPIPGGSMLIFEIELLKVIKN